MGRFEIIGELSCVLLIFIIFICLEIGGVNVIWSN